MIAMDCPGSRAKLTSLMMGSLAPGGTTTKFSTLKCPSGAGNGMGASRAGKAASKPLSLP